MLRIGPDKFFFISTYESAQVQSNLWNLRFSALWTTKLQSTKSEKAYSFLPSASFPSAHLAECLPAAAEWGRCTLPDCRHPSCWCLRSRGCGAARRLGTAGGVCWTPGDHLPPWFAGRIKRKEKKQNRKKIRLALFEWFWMSSLFLNRRHTKNEKCLVFSPQKEDIWNAQKKTKNPRSCF